MTTPVLESLLAPVDRTQFREQYYGKQPLLIAYLGVLGTSFAFFVQLRSARLSSSTRVGLILCTEPVFATIFAVLAAGLVTFAYVRTVRRDA